MTRLSSEQISSELKNLPGWSIKDEKLHRDFEFEDFNQAFGFMTRAAMHMHYRK
jgi:4a-hydroxytetrahydrobiopterin dehydratase